MFREYTIKKILVPTDFSSAAKEAIDHAVMVGQKFNAEILLVHVLERAAYSGVFTMTKTLESEERGLAEEKLNGDARELKKRSGLKVTSRIVSGRIYEQIVDMALEHPVDIIIMGTHGSSGWAEFFVGSNAFKVVTQSPCPILTVQQSAKKDEYRNIILPVDSTSETRQKVRYASAFAKKYGATIHIGALIVDDDPEVRFDFEKKVKQITNYLEREEVAYSDSSLVGSNIATMTMNFAESKDGDLIVMMTEQEFNLTGFLMGPYAQQIVNHSKIPVLSISPDDEPEFHMN